MAATDSTGFAKGGVIVVVGASRGIGKEIARLGVDRGATVVAVARSAPNRISAEGDTGGILHEISADALKVHDMASVADTVRDTYGRVDGWVNCVGGHVGDDGDLDTCEVDLFMQTVQLNLTSTFLGCKMALRLARETASRDVSVINVGSGDSNHSGRRIGYTSAKHGVVGLTRTLARSLAGDGIRVNCLCPGWTDTGLNNWAAIGEYLGLPEEGARLYAESQNAQKRVLGVTEVAQGAMFLLSTMSSGVTGQIINVDGGYRI